MRLSPRLAIWSTASPSCVVCIGNERCADVRLHTDTPIASGLRARRTRMPHLHCLLLNMMGTTAWVVCRLFALLFFSFNWIQSTPIRCLRIFRCATKEPTTCKAILMWDLGIHLLWIFVSAIITTQQISQHSYRSAKNISLFRVARKQKKKNALQLTLWRLYTFWTKIATRWRTRLSYIHIHLLRRPLIHWIRFKRVIIHI